MNDERTDNANLLTSWFYFCMRWKMIHKFAINKTKRAARTEKRMHGVHYNNSRWHQQRQRQHQWQRTNETWRMQTGMRKSCSRCKLNGMKKLDELFVRRTTKRRVYNIKLNAILRERQILISLILLIFSFFIFTSIRFSFCALLLRLIHLLHIFISFILISWYAQTHVRNLLLIFVWLLVVLVALHAVARRIRIHSQRKSHALPNQRTTRRKQRM